MTGIASRLLLPLFVVAMAVLVPGAHAALEKPRPAPELGPGEVVKIQLEALRGNDAQDSGIQLCFRFASPGNKVHTGPVERFGQMIRQEPYALMLSYLDVQYEPIEIAENRARQRVTLIGPTEAITYVFLLSRQLEAAEGGCKGCWMTDAVIVERVGRAV